MTDTASILARLDKLDRDNQTRANALKERVDSIASMTANLTTAIAILRPQNVAGLQANIQVLAKALAGKADTADRKLDKPLSR